MDNLISLAPIGSFIDNVWDELEARGNRPDIEITSIPSMNEKIWGFQKKKLAVIGARPSMGKSALALQIAHDASHSHNVLFVSLEMTKVEAVERMFCRIMNTPNTDVRQHGYYYYREKKEQFKAYVEPLRLIITETVGKRWVDIYDAIQKTSVSPELVIVDYIQYVYDDRKKKIEVIDEYIRNFREMAIKYNFAGIVLSQINRSNVGKETSEPTMVGLKGSGFLEEHADKVLLLHWDYHINADAPKNKLKVIVSKNKSGMTGSFEIGFEPEYYRFYDLERRELWEEEE